MGLNFNGNPPSFGGKVVAEVPTPTYSGKKSSNAANSINPYTTDGPGEAGAGLTEDQIDDIQGGGSSSGDANFADVSLLLKFDGADGTNTFTDDSLNGFSPTLVGTPTISTDQAKFGTSSGKFGLAGEYLSYTDQAQDLIDSTGDFTYDMWAYSPTLGSGTHVLMYSGPPADSNNRLGWYLQPSLMGVIWSGSGLQTVAATIPDSAWTHLALVQDGSTVRRFVNGVQLATYSHTFTVGRGALDDMLIGGHIPTGQPVVSPEYMDYVRITKGVVRWTADFTPPTIDDY